MRGSLGYTVASTGPFTFENTSDWSSSNVALTANADFRTQGVRSLGVPINGYRTVKSRAFSSSELSQVSGRINLDLFIPRPVPNAWWYGDVSLFLTCGNIINAEEFRGRGLAKALVRFALEHPDHRAVYKWLLGTRDAHGVYAAVGFAPLARPDVWMMLDKGWPPLDRAVRSE